MMLAALDRPPIGGPSATASKLTMAVFFTVVVADFVIGGSAPWRTSAEDRGSYWFIQLGQVAALGLGLAAPFVFPGASLPEPIWVAGIAIMIIGATLRFWAVRSLGENFRRDVAVAEGQQLVTSGPYHWVRHPSYTGALAVFMGLGVAQANWVSVFVLTVVPFTAYAYRIHVEEAVLRERLGERYRHFSATRRRLIPWIY